MGCPRHQQVRGDAHGLTGCPHSVVSLPTLMFGLPCCRRAAYTRAGYVVMLAMLVFSWPRRCHAAYTCIWLDKLLSCCLHPCLAGHIMGMLELFGCAMGVSVSSGGLVTQNEGVCAVSGLGYAKRACWHCLGAQLCEMGVSALSGGLFT